MGGGFNLEVQLDAQSSDLANVSPGSAEGAK